MATGIISNRSTDTGLREGFQGAIVNETPVAPTKADQVDGSCSPGIKCATMQLSSTAKKGATQCQ
jgi:hypothetical protein